MSIEVMVYLPSFLFIENVWEKIFMISPNKVCILKKYF